MNIGCPACRETIGNTDVMTVEQAVDEHGPKCTATAEEHERAVTWVRFMEIVGGDA
ncbi:hypothetical protein SEA_ELLIE_64 [Mycobacterium phage Ellie]|uniref:Uncharacterized protein n=1 Tax=Mycobacterium phage Ellie TaxID=2762405 RepID=A0A7G8LM16_9CAUD|nr:hypothetical protein I5G88_gp64 [Mycobacterium phage Ellie]QNJ58288.1 hypothetical protein SEA_ELLIE_64 [Mycobacterium phage Ellie]QTF82065.1 hypothetical protein SEA_FEFFERHEAD_66 [Mycobacterium phage Fefferhead]